MEMYFLQTLSHIGTLDFMWGFRSQLWCLMVISSFIPASSSFLALTLCQAQGWALEIQGEVETAPAVVLELKIRKVSVRPLED